MARRQSGGPVEPDRVDPAGPLVGRRGAGARCAVQPETAAARGTRLRFRSRVCASPYYSGKVLRDPFTGRPYDRASDPWVDIGPDGTAYAVTISFDANDNGGSIGAATSSDGGRTWHNQQNIVAEDANDPSFPFNDKESDTADPVRAGTAYAVWDRLQNIACPPGVPPAQRQLGRPGLPAGRRACGAATAVAAAALDCFDGPGTLSRTTNFGRTWSTPITIVPTPANEQTIGNEIVVDPNTGTVYDFYMYIHADNSLTIEDVASHDRGRTWGPRQLVSDSQTIGVADPVTGAPLRTGDIIPQPAIDPRSGQLYVVWQDSRANATDPNQDALFISTSRRGRADGHLERAGGRQRAGRRGRVHGGGQGAGQRRGGGRVLRPQEPGG